MGLLDQFSEFAKTPEGQGLLSAAFGGLAGAQRGAPLNSIGRAGLAGLAGYSGALDRQQSQADNAFNQQYRTLQMDELKRKQAEAAAQQQWRQGLPDVLKQAQTTYGAGDEGPTMTPGNPDALKGYLMRPDSPFLDEVLKQQMFPTPDDYKVVGSDLVKIGKGGVTVAHQSQRPDNLTSDQKQYNLAVDQGFKGTFMDFLRERVNTTEGAKASLDLVEITTPDGKAYKVPRSRAVGMAGGSTPSPRPNGYSGGSAAAAATDQVAIISKELENARAAGRTQDVLALEKELGRLNRNAPGLQVQSESEKVAAVEGAKNAATNAQAQQKDRQTARKFLGQAQLAEKLLSQNPTGSGIGAARDQLLGFFGQTTESAKVAQQLKGVSGWLVSNVPRMEGPQSNFDVENYMRMAGQVGDDRIPVPQRLAALKTIQQMMLGVIDPASADAAANGKSSAMSSGGWSATIKK